MTTYRQSLGFSVGVFKPSITSSGYTPNGEFLFSLSEDVSFERLETQAIGGYYAAEFSFPAGDADIENWVADGLGRHMEIYDNSMDTIWEGFVDEIKIQIGSLEYSIGPMSELCNRSSVVYRDVDYGETPPVLGDTMTSILHDNETSQGQYGIWERILTGGELTLTEAEELAELYLNENCWPGRSHMLGSSSSERKITLVCSGYFRFLEGYICEMIAIGGIGAASDKLIDIIDLDPNGLFSSDNADIEENLTPVGFYEDDYQDAWTLIKTILELGSGTDLRCTFGVYNGRRIVYGSIPTEFSYEKRLYDDTGNVYDMVGNIVVPYRVLPARWLFLSDWLIATSAGKPTKEDPRATFIESVTFSPPDSLELIGERVHTLAQRMAKINMTRSIEFG